MRWHGTLINCHLEVAIVWSCSVTSEPRLYSRSAVSKDTGRKSVVSSGAPTTSCSPRVEMTTKYVVGELRLCPPPLSLNTSVSPLFASPPVPTCCPAVAACVEPLKCPPSAAVHRALSRRESHRLVPTPARTAGLRRGHCWPLYPLLEHTDRPAPAVHGHWVAGLQPGLV